MWDTLLVQYLLRIGWIMLIIAEQQYIFLFYPSRLPTVHVKAHFQPKIKMHSVCYDFMDINQKAFIAPR